MWCSKCNRDHGPACLPSVPPLFNGGILNPMNPQASPMLDHGGVLRPQFQNTLFGQIHILNGGPLGR